MDSFKFGGCDESTLSLNFGMIHFLITKNQGVFVKHYGIPPTATKSKKLFLALRSKSR